MDLQYRCLLLAAYDFIAFEEWSVYFAFVTDIHSHLVHVCDLHKVVVGIAIVRNSSSITRNLQGKI